VIGLEAKKQFDKIGLYPDVIFGPCGGGSSFGGIAFPFLADKAAGDKRAANLRCVAVEPTSCPTLTKGAYAYDYGDVSGYTPIMRMYTLGHDFMPPGIHAGGLRYHGDSPLVSQLLHEGLIEALAVPQVATFEAGVQFARAEGIIPAPESCHGIVPRARIPVGDRPRGARPDAGAGRCTAGCRGGVRRRRVERHRPVPPIRE